MIVDITKSFETENHIIKSLDIYIFICTHALHIPFFESLNQSQAKKQLGEFAFWDVSYQHTEINLPL